MSSWTYTKHFKRRVFNSNKTISFNDYEQEKSSASLQMLRIFRCRDYLFYIEELNQNKIVTEKAALLRLFLSGFRIQFFFSSAPHFAQKALPGFTAVPHLVQKETGRSVSGATADGC